MCRRILLVRLLTRLHIEIALLSRSNWISFTRGNLNSKNKIFFYQVSNNWTSELFMPRSIEWAPCSSLLITFFSVSLCAQKVNGNSGHIFWHPCTSCVINSVLTSLCLDRFLGQKHFCISTFLFRGFLQRLFFLPKQIKFRENFSFSP